MSLLLNCHSFIDYETFYINDFCLYKTLGHRKNNRKRFLTAFDRIGADISKAKITMVYCMK